MNPSRFSSRCGAPFLAFSSVVALSFLITPAISFAQGGKRKDPTSKVYIADVGGEALVDTGEAIDDLAKRAVYTAQGIMIETKRPENEDDRAKYFSTMVYSNGTGAFFDADTRVEVQKFRQEPFTPNRTDLQVEPSISQTQAFVSRGAIGLCTSKLVAGSNMTYQTPHGSVNIRGQKVVIEAQGDVTKISMLDGDSTVRGGPQDLGGYTLHAGEQALIRRGPPGQPNLVQIQRIPASETAQLDEKVAMACQAKKTVYFEEREINTSSSADGNNAAGGGADDQGGAGDGSVFLRETKSGSTSVPGGVAREIIAVEVVPANLPVQFTVSPATLINPAGTVTPGPGNGQGPNPGP